MPPVTRSSTRHNVPKFSKDLSPSRASPPYLRHPDRAGKGRLLDWITITPATTTDNDEEPDWIDRFFETLRRDTDYRFLLKVRRARPSESPTTEWLMLAWEQADLRAKFLVSEQSRLFTDALADLARERSVTTSLVDLYRTYGAFHGVYVRPMEFYEFMAVYFPEDLSATVMAKLELLKGPFTLGNPIHPDDPQFNSPFPLDQFIDWNHGWLDGTVEFQGQRTRCLVYVFRWDGAEGEQGYKQFRIRTNTSWWGEFLMKLEDHGMLGYESQHASFPRRF